MNLAEKPIPEDVEIKEFSPEMLAFVESNFERLDHIADEHAWLNEHFTPLMDKDIPNRDEGWYISVNRKRYERVRIDSLSPEDAARKRIDDLRIEIDRLETWLIDKENG